MSVGYKIFDVAALLRRPAQDYLIHRVCPVASLVLVHGQSGAGKSFLATDVAFAVASGRPWHGYKVKQGSVLYVAAEGQGGLSVRIRAWLEWHKIEGEFPDIGFILEAVDPLNPIRVNALLQQLEQRIPKPSLVIVDTWSACLGVGGGDENSTKDTSQAVAAWRKIINTIGTSVWIIHHQGHKEHERARGNSALKAAAEVEIAVRQDRAKIIHTENKKQRDAAPFDPLHFQLHVVDLGDEQDSCILLPANAPTTADVPTLAPSVQAALTALLNDVNMTAVTEEAEWRGITFSAWRECSGQADSTFKAAIRALYDGGYVMKEGEGKAALYLPTISGENEIESEDDE